MFYTYRGRNVDDPVLGIAFVGGMCLRNFSSSVVEDGGSDLDQIGVVAAHELGHNFHFFHDDELGT